MIHFYTNRELSEILDVNLARWKRWSRAFLPPDPLGGMRSGYARQYVFKDLFKVFLGGYLLSHLKMSVLESRQILTDLSLWLEKHGFYADNGGNGQSLEKRRAPYRIHVAAFKTDAAKNQLAFAYLIQKTIDLRIDSSSSFRCVIETMEETVIPDDRQQDKGVFAHNPNLHTIHISALYEDVIERLHPPAINL